MADTARARSAARGTWRAPRWLPASTALIGAVLVVVGLGLLFSGSTAHGSISVTDPETSGRTAAATTTVATTVSCQSALFAGVDATDTATYVDPYPSQDERLATGGAAQADAEPGLCAAVRARTQARSELVAVLGLLALGGGALGLRRPSPSGPS